ncbi:hypothetical protein ECP03047993_0016 [Escherichia coli P0304799.3]|nr:hypothetical protein ECP03047993_0016 [Escherichia coli P0304799.3]
MVHRPGIISSQSKFFILVLVNDAPNMLLFLMKRLLISPFEKMVFDKSLSKHNILDNTQPK